VNTDENVADLLIKLLSGPKQARFVWMLLIIYSLREGSKDMFTRVLSCSCCPQELEPLPLITHGVS
jgi:hypothetical protein